jgi:hypothetical protein
VSADRMSCRRLPQEIADFVPPADRKTRQCARRSKSARASIRCDRERGACQRRGTGDASSDPPRSRDCNIHDNIGEHDNLLA